MEVASTSQGLHPVAEPDAGTKDNGSKCIYDIDSQDDVHPQALTPLRYSRKPKSLKGVDQLHDVKKENVDHAAGNQDETEKNWEQSSCSVTAGRSVTISEVKMTSAANAVVYVYSPELLHISSQMEKIQGRAFLVHSLIAAYNLTSCLKVVPPRHATEKEILSFHSEEYVKFLHKVSQTDDDEKFEEEANQFGLTYDCPVHEGLYEYGSLTGGATLTAAECLLRGECLTAINWCGGWHHAKKDQASGFCYVNDIVLGILKLREKFDKVLYVDLDVHHGDGVEEAFCASTKVLTLSVHKKAAGFYPGTGDLLDVGVGKAKYYTVNVPLSDGIRDTEYVSLVCRILQKVKEVFIPDAVVCQCGADGLAGDPMDSFNLTHLALAKPLYFITNWKIPTLILGGVNKTKQPGELQSRQRLLVLLAHLAARNQYDNDVTVWSPQGRIHQIEYAMEAVKQGSATVGLKSKTHAILVALKRAPSELSAHQKKIIPIDDHIGVSIAGLTADARLLSNFMRSECLNSRYAYDRPLPVSRLVTTVGNKSQIPTQRYGRRPFGVGLLVAGYDEQGPHIYQTCPSANYYDCKAMAIGARSQSARTYVEKFLDKFQDCTLEELIKHGLLALRDTLPQEVELTTKNCSMGIVGKEMDFTIYDDDQMTDYLKLIEGEERSRAPAQAPEDQAAMDTQQEGEDQPPPPADPQAADPQAEERMDH
ncbi:hypothetical protein FSP39_002875 [Pinctada imbricata]|uniref:Histone deacetylase 8 n=1 Tax=Pinctada imbricata TaxID=66713 RepID=A0AA89BUQ6_PINIB|nr:hypothetical protein FSP39_002875 [Pinctada imbricata]